MNERHEQLMAQAWIEFAPDAKAVTKRFAELIVIECMDIVEGEDDGSADTKSVRLAMIRMKQHFGVAE